MIYLLDTNAWSRYINRRPSPVKAKVEAIGPRQLRLCSVVKAEMYYGAHKGQETEANLAILATLFGAVESLPFDDRAAERCGRIRAELAKAGTIIGPNDLMIAAIALVNNLTLVTNNTSEFGRVPGLAVEDWQQP